MVFSDVVIKTMEINEAQEVEELIQLVFSQYISYDYSEEGVEDFLEYVGHKKMLQRVLSKGYEVLLAKVNNEVIGMIETRGNSHISLLFVHKNYQKKGIAKCLVEKAFSVHTGDITVNATPFAAPIYKKMGFVKISGDIIKNGNTYIPMIKEAEPSKKSKI